MARKSKRSNEPAAQRSKRPAAPATEAADKSREKSAAGLWPLQWNLFYCAVLLLAIAYAYSPVVVGRNIDFIHFDDDRYVFNNAMVVRGLSWQTVRWAFTSLELDNWHPLTWLSHMADVRLYGIAGHAWEHHRTSVVLHAMASVALFFALSRLTLASWPSALATLLFAVHPLRVESVAWISERKDTLSGLFFALTLWAYSGYARRDYSTARYLLVLVFYALGLMSKPMLVSVPILLLLLDFWPLDRWKRAWADKATLRRILLEKAPLAAMALASCRITLIAQKGAMLVIDPISRGLRIENAIVSYASYIVQLFVPINLTALYPYPEHGIPAIKVALAVIALLAISTAAVAARRHRYLVVGWLWFLITLLPVIGIVQVGVQGMADRYTYIPEIGLGIMLSWLLWEMTSRWPLLDLAWTGGLGILAVVLMIATNRQTATWKNDEVFFNYSLTMNPNSSLAHNNLGYLRERQGNLVEAEWHYSRALEIRPHYVEPKINMGAFLMNHNRAKEAIGYFIEATKIRPDYDQGFLCLGKGYLGIGDKTKAIDAFREAIRLDHDYADAHYSLAMVFLETNRIDEGAHELKEVLRTDGNNQQVLKVLGEVYLQTQRPAQAAECYRKLLTLNAKDPPLETLAVLAYADYTAHKPADAIAGWRKVMQIKPQSITALTMIAWTLATSDDNSVRDGAEAKRLAEQAVRLAGDRNPAALLTLAAAQAECGQFDQANQLAGQATTAAQAANANLLAQFAGMHITSYKARLPYRDSTVVAPGVFFPLKDIMAAR